MVKRQDAARHAEQVAFVGGDPDDIRSAALAAREAAVQAGDVQELVAALEVERDLAAEAAAADEAKVIARAADMLMQRGADELGEPGARFSGGSVEARAVP